MNYAEVILDTDSLSLQENPTKKPKNQQAKTKQNKQKQQKPLITFVKLC